MAPRTARKPKVNDENLTVAEKKNVAKSKVKNQEKEINLDSPALNGNVVDVMPAINKNVRKDKKENGVKKPEKESAVSDGPAPTKGRRDRKVPAVNYEEDSENEAPVQKKAKKAAAKKGAKDESEVAETNSNTASKGKKPAATKAEQDPSSPQGKTKRKGVEETSDLKVKKSKQTVTVLPSSSNSGKVPARTRARAEKVDTKKADEAPLTANGVALIEEAASEEIATPADDIASTSKPKANGRKIAAAPKGVAPKKTEKKVAVKKNDKSAAVEKSEKPKPSRGKTAKPETVELDVEVPEPTAAQEEPEVVPPKPKTKRGKVAKPEASVLAVESVAAPEEPEHASAKPKAKRGKAAEATKPLIPSPSPTDFVTKVRRGNAAIVIEKVTNEATSAQKDGRAKKNDAKPVQSKEITEKKARKPKKRVVPRSDDSCDDENDQDFVPEPATAKKATKPRAKATTEKGPKMNATNTDYSKIDFTFKEKFNLKISSWNVAGLRALANKGGFEYFDYEKPDIICLQEIKCLEDEVPNEARLKGYHPYWNTKEGGHAGVAIYSKIMPYHVQNGFDDENEDEYKGRLITAEFEKFYLVCVYVPNSGRKLVTLPGRLTWNEQFEQHLVKLNEKKPVIVCGDMNVAHSEIDLKNPKTNTKNAGFTKEEREGMTKLLSLGFVDTFRHLYPKEEGAYTFWSYMGQNRTKNVGWRLDYYITSERLMPKVVENIIRPEILGSDHCPIVLLLNL